MYARVKKRGWIAIFLLTALVTILVLLLGLPVTLVLGQTKARVFVYLNTTMRPRKLQAELQKSLPGTEVRVFGRVRDFTHAVSEESPEVIITRRALIEEVGMAPGIQGMRNGKATENYSLLAVDKAVQAQDLAGKAVGVVDFLGRKGMAALVSSLLGVKPKIKRTTKVEDLLALMQFSAADAVFLPKRNISILRKSTALKLVETELSDAKVSLPAVGFSSASAKESLGPLIGNFDNALNEKMGVDSWQ